MDYFREQREYKINKIIESRYGSNSQLQIVRVHQLDCIYYGQINKSYQRQGFGILQTIDFQHYFGFWKNNKADGKGVLIYPSGEIIYGNFNRDQLAGLSIIDNERVLRIGVFEGIDAIGIGYEYTYDSKIWRMIRYNKGHPIVQIKQTKMALQQGLPQMITSQYSFFQMLSDYLKVQFFKAEDSRVLIKKSKNLNKNQTLQKYNNINQQLIKKDEDIMLMGFRDEGGLHGLACIYDFNNKSMRAAGFYKGKDKHGYCMNVDEQENKTIGLYINNVKQGIFLISKDNQSVGQQFYAGQYVGQSTFTFDLLQKKQKLYNYEQKQFLSSNNSFDFLQIFQVFVPPQTRSYKRRTLSFNQNIQQLLGSSPKQQTKNNQVRRQDSRQQSKDKRTKMMQKIRAAKSIPEPQSQKSSIQIMREKLKEFNLVSQQKQARYNSEKYRQKLINYNLVSLLSQTQQSIAQQQNPFDLILSGENYINSSPPRRKM